jgi:choline dehydrogenase
MAPSSVSSKVAVLSTSLFLAAAVGVSASSLEKQPIDWRLKARSTVTDAATLADQTFDYVIVG